MIKGITEGELKIIKEILQNYDAKFFAYGSRVKGDFSDLSDLDILVKSDKNILPDLKNRFDKSYLPYIVNFTDFNSIDKNFYNLIKNDLTEIIITPQP